MQIHTNTTRYIQIHTDTYNNNARFHVNNAYRYIRYIPIHMDTNTYNDTYRYALG